MWFQDDSQFHEDNVQKYIAHNLACKTLRPKSDAYATAKQLVSKCMPDLISAIKNIRANGIRIHEIDSDMLIARLPNIDRQTIEKLSSKFGVTARNI